MLNGQFWKEVETLGKPSCGQFGFIKTDYMFPAVGLPNDLQNTSKFSLSPVAKYIAGPMDYMLFGTNTNSFFFFFGGGGGWFPLNM